MTKRNQVSNFTEDHSDFANGQNLKNSAKKMRKGNVTASSAEASQISRSYAGGPDAKAPVTIGASERYRSASALPMIATRIALTNPLAGCVNFPASEF